MHWHHVDGSYILFGRFPMSLSEIDINVRNVPSVTRYWRAVDGEDLVWRDWDGDCVVFSPTSGNTHVLDILSGEVLKAIAEARRRNQELVSHAALYLDVPESTDLKAVVRDVTERLEAAGLIEEVADCR